MKITRRSSCLSGVQICRLVPLKVLKSKMTTVKITAVLFRTLSRKNITEYVLCCTSCRSDNILGLHLSNRFGLGSA